jgi:hypothetical protein
MGDGTPKGLPLIIRFSDAISVFNSISQWRTLILVTPLLWGHALSFPVIVSGHLLMIKHSIGDYT